MRMFTKVGLTVASGTFPLLLWAGAAGAQSTETTQSQSFVDPCSQSQSASQSQCTTTPTSPTSVPAVNGGFGGGSGGLARTGADDLLPLALGGVAIAGAVVVRGVRRRSAG